MSSISSEHMNAPGAPTDFSWAYELIGHLLEVLGLGGLGLAWRGNSRVTKLEVRTEALKDRVDAHDEGREAIAERLASIRESVARLPTRDELDDLRHDLKQDYRASRD
jgi:hypothetical protein